MQRFVVFTLLLWGGCQPPQLDFTEIHRPEEPLSRLQWEKFVRIVKSLPGGRLPPLPPVFIEPPEWSPNRTLTVHELHNEARRELDQVWEIDRWASRFQRDTSVMRALRRERWSPEQLAGIAQTIGLSAAALYSPETKRLDSFIVEGAADIELLVAEETVFETLTAPQQFDVIQRAKRLLRWDRARRVMRPCEANRELARKNQEWLAKCLPEEFVTNPFQGVDQLLGEQGVPFEELDASGSDRSLGWDRQRAQIGRDQPPAKNVSESKESR